MPSTLEQKLTSIHFSPDANDFIIADAKDSDMAFGMAGTGLAVNGRHPSLADFRQKIRDVVEQGLVDIVIMSASTTEKLAVEERIFEGTDVTPAARANDTTDIWLARHGTYSDSPSRPFRSASLDHVQPGANLGLYSMTFNNDIERDHASLMAFKEFRHEAEAKGFKYFLEIFAPNMPEAVPADGVGQFINDHIARSLAGVTNSQRPLFLKMPYNGPDALEELVAYDPSLVVGILGGASGTTMDAFTLLAEAKKYGGRAALFGRKINHAEDQLVMIEFLHQIANGNIEPDKAVKDYHQKLADKKVAPYRSLDDDSKITAPELAYLR